MDEPPPSKSYKWPNGSCSAALVHHVFVELTDARPTAKDIMAHLGISEKNGLAATEKVRQVDDGDLGIDLSDFISSCGRIFEDFGVSINFLWVPFNEIPFKLYADAIQEHSRKGAIVGCCLDYSVISKSSTTHRHICRCEYTNGSISLINDDLPSNVATDTVPLELWEKSIEKINGGLFVFSV